MWNKDELTGKADQVKGRIKHAAGDALDDDELREEGIADEAAGNVQEAFGRGKRKIGEAIENLGNTIKK